MNIKTVRNDAHAKLKIKSNPSFVQSKNHHAIPVDVYEFSEASQEFPLTFVKDKDANQFRAVAIVGLQPGENLFYCDEGWRADYVPVSLRSYPFIAVNAGEQSDRLLVCIDEDSDLINESEGERLFDDAGEQTEYLKQRGQALLGMYERNLKTKEFVSFLVAKNLLVSKTMTVELPGQEAYNISGIYVIDETALGEMSDEEFSEIRKLNYLWPIYASLLSLSRFNKLARMKSSA